ncbi:MAG TPA: ABC transporter permease [Gemmataceae bacterium]|nr:ABC transporter permease [Gemmataceae bacterium]
MTNGNSPRRIYSVARKELLHILRDPMTLFMTLFFPVVELMMLGYAIETNVRDIPTVVFDQAKTQESRSLLREFENTGDFKVVAVVNSDDALHEAIVAGKARVGVKVPEDYSRRLQKNDTAQVLILVDGSVSSIAAEAVNVGNAIALRQSLQRALGTQQLPVEARPRVLFNPDMYSANFFIPGLLVVLSQMMAITLSANAIVREKEKGTLEQLFMTPVSAGELIVGKMIPYLAMTFLEFCGIALLMNVIFRVPIHGQFLTLLAIAVPFVLTCLGWGLWVSTKVSTRDAAMQTAMATLMPCIFLSGYVFPLDSMPVVFWYVAQVIPTTWMIDASRGVILRGAGWKELWVNAAVLWAMAAMAITFSVLRFRKRLT